MFRVPITPKPCLRTMLDGLPCQRFLLVGLLHGSVRHPPTSSKLMAPALPPSLVRAENVKLCAAGSHLEPKSDRDVCSGR